MAKRPKRPRTKHRRRDLGDQRQRRLKKQVDELYPLHAPRAPDPPAEDRWDEVWESWEAERPAPRAEPTAGAPAAPRADERSGVVTALASGICWVEAGGERLRVAIPSRLARDQQGRLAVGDEVRARPAGAGTFRLVEVLPRRSLLSRPAPHNPRRRRLIAANVDVVMHVASVGVPAFRPGLVDRTLVAIAHSGAEPAVAVNKVDLLAEDERPALLEQLAPYSDLGIGVLLCSCHTGEGIEEVRRALAGKTAVLVGHSGVGKSSFLQALAPGLEVRIGEAAGTARRGRHTTTRAHLYELEGGIRVIDTPGIRELGLWRLGPEELRRAFPDLEQHADRCRFPDCTHIHEPDCAVQAAADTGEVSDARYRAYRRILDSLAEGS